MASKLSRQGVLKERTKIDVPVVPDEADVERTLAVFKEAMEAIARF